MWIIVLIPSADKNNSYVVTGGTARCLRALAALPEGTRLIPSTYMATHNHWQLQFQEIQCPLLASMGSCVFKHLTQSLSAEHWWYGYKQKKPRPPRSVCLDNWSVRDPVSKRRWGRERWKETPDTTCGLHAHIHRSHKPPEFSKYLPLVKLRNDYSIIAAWEEWEDCSGGKSIIPTKFCI